MEEGKLAEVAEPQEVWSKAEGSCERWSGPGRRAVRVELREESDVILEWGRQPAVLVVHRHSRLVLSWPNADRRFENPTEGTATPARSTESFFTWGSTPSAQHFDLFRGLSPPPKTSKSKLGPDSGKDGVLAPLPPPPAPNVPAAPPNKNAWKSASPDNRQIYRKHVPRSPWTLQTG